MKIGLVLFGFVWFCDISTIADYLSNLLYSYILDIHDLVLLGFMAGYWKPNPFLYIHIKYIWFGLFGFYGISTIVGYLMPNPLYTYISIIYLALTIQHQSFFYMQLDDQTVQFNLACYFFAHSLNVKQFYMALR